MDFSSELSGSLQLYSESSLYRVAGSVCMVVAASQRTQGLVEQPQLLNLSQEQLQSMQLMVDVGTKVQEMSCAWVSGYNLQFHGTMY